jgi:hypothetical protein
MTAMTGDIKLGDRLFNVVNYDVITVANEAYIHALMRSTGLDLPLPFNEGETDIEYQVRLQARVTDTLKLPELLGGFLLPVGKTETDWDEQLAAATAKFIRGLTARADREEVFRLAFQVNIYFFREGIASLNRSQSYLERAETMLTRTKKSQPGHPPAAH